jgi:hypothetical protein
MLETALPAVAFVAAYSVSGQDTNTAAIVAVGLALVLSVARLVRRESPRHALSGLFGVALAGFIATRSGRAENFFLPGLLANAAYAAAFLISLAVRKPLVGVIVRQLEPHAERPPDDDPGRRRAFERATLMWSGCSSCAWRSSCRCTWRARWSRSVWRGPRWACRSSRSGCG